MLARVAARGRPWDIVVVGGGATGIGIAVDAASRGYDVLLLERSDFGKGTYSRSTKLVHGGVRYLAQGHLPLVRRSLRERGLLLRNAPHLVSDLPFVVPCYAWWETPFYGAGLKLYGLLAGREGLGRTEILSPAETLDRVPTLRPEGLRGGVVYHDGLFDDARLLVHLAWTAAEQGATLVNYAEVEGFLREGDGPIRGVRARDVESGEPLTAEARVVVNATGAFCDALRRLADPGAGPLVAASQGIHLVVERAFLPGGSAIVVPHTSDGRLLFAIPWHDHTIVGTTDTPIARAEPEPRPLPEEIGFVLENAGRYLCRPPGRADVLSTFAGVRPLVRSGSVASTAGLSRDHTIRIDSGGLLTITGGKWTTYRSMAEDCVDRAATLAGLEASPCRTHDLRVHGHVEDAAVYGALSVYGADAPRIQALAASDPALAAPLHPALRTIAAEVVWAVRFEMARTVEDVLARRTRVLFLDAAAALAAAGSVGEVMAKELGKDPSWARDQMSAFAATASGYRVA